MSLNLFNIDKKPCFYHPSKTSEPTVQCHKCKRFVCQNDIATITNNKLQVNICPVCYTKQEKLESIVITLHIIPLGVILGPLLVIGGLYILLTSFETHDFFHFIIFAFFEPFFALTAVVLFIAPFEEHKKISRLEYKTLLFLESATADKDRTILKYQSTLASKFASKDLQEPQQEILATGDTCPSCGSFLSTKNYRCSNCGTYAPNSP